MKVALAERLNDALAGIDTAKAELRSAIRDPNTGERGEDGAIEAAGDTYLAARDEMAATMAAIAEPEQPPA